MKEARTGKGGGGGFRVEGLGFARREGGNGGDACGGTPCLCDDIGRRALVALGSIRPHAKV
eukprot:365691-Chlamydomonas_euryale.AAC.4